MFLLPPPDPAAPPVKIPHLIKLQIGRYRYNHCEMPTPVIDIDHGEVPPFERPTNPAPPRRIWYAR